MSREAAMDVVNAETQEQIGSSLLGPEQEAELSASEQPESEYVIHGDEALSQEVDRVDEERYRMEHGDAAWNEKYGQETQQEQREVVPVEHSARLKTGEEQAEQAVEQQEQQAVAEPTPEQYRAEVERQDGIIKQFGLAEDAPKLAADLAPFLGNAVYENAAKLGSMTARLAIDTRDSLLSAYQAGAVDPSGDLDTARLPLLTDAAVKESSRTFAEVCGINWQLNPIHDERLVAYAMRNGYANMLHAANRLNSTDPMQLNDKRMCVAFCQVLQKGLIGTERPVSETKAVEFVNALTRHALTNQLPKIRTAAEQLSQPAKQRKSSGQRIPRGLAPGIRGTKPKYNMQSNQDLFDDESVRAAGSQRL